MKAAMDRVLENQLLSRWAPHLRRRPDQLNAIHQADAELIPLGGGQVLALTVDTISEEIQLGFYRGAETMGWVAATASLSDLAAVGARPLGLVVSVTLPHGQEAHLQPGIARGLDAACAGAGTFVLGGDTNSGDAVAITSCAVGLCDGGAPTLRTGCAVGHELYVTGPLGAGVLPAARALMELPAGLVGDQVYRPTARIAQGVALRGLASSCMDTSDGLLATLDQLARLNGVAVRISSPPQSLLDPTAQAMSQAMGESAVTMLACHHGEFELAFTVPPERVRELERAADVLGERFLHVGRVEQGAGLWLGEQHIDGAALRNLAARHAHDPGLYLQELRSLTRHL